jgi:hypothetical protein
MLKQLVHIEPMVCKGLRLCPVVEFVVNSVENFCSISFFFFWFSLFVSWSVSQVSDQ